MPSKYVPKLNVSIIDTEGAWDGFFVYALSKHSLLEQVFHNLDK